MVIDSSALLAILLAEPERASFERAMARAVARYISPVNWFETSMVAISRISDGHQQFELLFQAADVAVVPVDEAQMRLADQAWRIYGKGRQHPAQLNLGDCFAYALAKQLGEPLLFKGGDFSKTDVIVAV